MAFPFFGFVASFSSLSYGVLSRPSLRANGSRERAPDDKLREAIHSHKERVDCFVASLLAMTADSHFCPDSSSRPGRNMLRRASSSNGSLTNLPMARPACTWGAHGCRVPALDVRIIVERKALRLVGHGPGKAGDVGNRIVARQIAPVLPNWYRAPDKAFAPSSR